MGIAPHAEHSPRLSVRFTTNGASPTLSSTAYLRHAVDTSTFRFASHACPVAPRGDPC
ncbi:MAG: chitobiase/beta-hexosaminidase C-terminal domain-containing protein [Candidatus Limisoma sp.]